jgi:hypothetical protein
VRCGVLVRLDAQGVYGVAGLDGSLCCVEPQGREAHPHEVTPDTYRQMDDGMTGDAS